jgi:hypothetical protein
MPATRTQREELRLDRHKEGTIRAKGRMLGGLLHGYWEWFRNRPNQDAFRILRPRQAGEWKTYARDGRLVRVTELRPEEKEREPTA